MASEYQCGYEAGVAQVRSHTVAAFGEGCSEEYNNGYMDALNQATRIRQQTTYQTTYETYSTRPDEVTVIVKQEPSADCPAWGFNRLQ